MFLERQMTDNTMLDVAQIPLSPCFAGGGVNLYALLTRTTGLLSSEMGQPQEINATDFTHCHIRVPSLGRRAGRWLVKFTLKTEVTHYD